MSNQQCLLMVFSLQSWHMNQPKSILFDLVMHLTLCLTTSFRPLYPKFLRMRTMMCPAESTRATQSCLSLSSYLHGWLLLEDDSGVYVGVVCLIVRRWELGRLDYSFVALRNRKISPTNSHVEKLRVSFGSLCIFILTLPPFKQKERKVTNTVL